MSIRLPDFRDKRCRMLTLCGAVLVEEGKEAADLPKKEVWSIARYSKAGQTVYVRLGLTPGKRSPHFHLDVARREIFQKGKLPEPNLPVKQLQETIDSFVGKQIDVGKKATYRLPQNDLPPLIRSTIAEARADNVRIKMTGGTLSVEGSPINTIAWESIGDTGDVLVTLKARAKVTIGESYLEDALSLMESAFTAFILGGPRDA
jgi:hypothetical protein